MSTVTLPDPDRAVMARRNEVVKQLKKLAPQAVMIADLEGRRTFESDALAAYRRLLFPRAAVVTPNLDELRILSGEPCRDLAGMEEAGRRLVERHGCPFLLKGGHLGGRVATDILVTAAGSERFSAPFRRGVETHGTGCTYSAAIATGLAHGLPLVEAVARAKAFITAAIGGSLTWGTTTALDHRVSIDA